MSQASAELHSELHRLTRVEYEQLVESGGLDEDARIELIDGLLCDMSPKTREHELALAYLLRLLAARLDHEAFALRIGAPLSIGDSEPEPDVAVVRSGTPEPYHPASAALVIEVAVSSRVRDLRVKPRVYATAEVTEYWVLDLDRSQAFVHRHPAGGAYRSRAELDDTAVLDGSVVGVGAIALRDVLNAAAPRLT